MITQNANNHPISSNPSLDTVSSPTQSPPAPEVSRKLTLRLPERLHTAFVDELRRAQAQNPREVPRAELAYELMAEGILARRAKRAPPAQTATAAIPSPTAVPTTSSALPPVSKVGPTVPVAPSASPSKPAPTVGSTPATDEKSSPDMLKDRELRKLRERYRAARNANHSAAHIASKAGLELEDLDPVRKPARSLPMRALAARKLSRALAKLKL